MNQDEIKTMMRSFERLQAKSNRSAQNTMSLNDMWHKMPQIIMHQITVIEEYQEGFDRLKQESEQLQAELKALKGTGTEPERKE